MIFANNFSWFSGRNQTCLGEFETELFATPEMRRIRRIIQSSVVRLFVIRLTIIK